MAAGKSTCAGAFTFWALVSAFAQTAPSSHAPTPAASPNAFNVSLPDIGSAINSSCRLSVPAGADTRDPAKVAEIFANNRLAEWQQRLNLEDWTISVVMTRRSDLKPRTLGAIRWDKPKKTAVMWGAGRVRESAADVRNASQHGTDHRARARSLGVILPAPERSKSPY